MSEPHRLPPKPRLTAHTNSRPERHVDRDVAGSRQQGAGAARVPAASGDDLSDVTRHWSAYEQSLDATGGQIGSLDVGGWTGTAHELFEHHRGLARRRMLAASDTAGTVRAALVRWQRALKSVVEQHTEIELALQSVQPGSQAELTLLERQTALRAHLDDAAADTVAHLRDAAARAPKTSLFSDPTPPDRYDLTPEQPRTRRYDADYSTLTPTQYLAGDTGTSSAASTVHPPLRHSAGEFNTVSTALSSAEPALPPGLSPSSPSPSSPSPSGLVIPATVGSTPAPTAAAPVVLVPVSDATTGHETGRRRWWVNVDVPTGDGIHDTLSRIAARELGDPNRWPEIYALNHGRPQQHYGPLHDPNLIHPGWALEIQAPDSPPDPATQNPATPNPPGGDSGPGCTPTTPSDPPALPGDTGTPVPPAANPPAHNPPGPLVHHQPGHSVVSTPGVLIALAVATTIVGCLAVLHKTTTRSRSTRTATTDSPDDHQSSLGPPPPSIGSLADALRQRPDPTGRPAPHPAKYQAGHQAVGNLDAGGWGTDPWARSFPRSGPQPAPNQDLDGATSGTEHALDHDTTPTGTDLVLRNTLAGVPDSTLADPVPNQLRRALGIRTLPRHPSQPDHRGTLRDAEDGDLDGGEELVFVDLAAVTGLGLHGPATPDALRAILIELLTPHTPEHPVDVAQVLIPAHDAQTLLGITPVPGTDPAAGEFVDEDGHPRQLPAGLQVVADLQAALDELEAQITRRLRTHLDPAETDADQADSRPRSLVLIAQLDADIEAYGDRRLQSVLDHGARLGIAAVLGGSWVAGTTCHLDSTATITHATGPAARALRDTSLFTMPTQHALDTLELFAQLDEHQSHLTDHPAATAIDHVADRRHSPDPDDSPEGDDAEDRQHSPGQIELALNPQPRSTAPASREQAADLTGVLNRTVDEPEHTPTDQIGDQTDGGPDTDAQDADQPTLTTSSTAHNSTTSAGAEHETGASLQLDNLDHPAPAGNSPAPEQGSADVEGLNTDSDTAPLPTTPDAGPPAHARIAVHAFGELRVHARAVPGGALNDITAKLSPTQRRLLACLAASTRPVSADTLIDTCWPGPPAHNALPKLHTAIYRLRTVFRQEIGDTTPALLVHAAERYEFDRAYCWVDHHAFFDALRAARTATTPAAQADALRNVVGLHTGALLDGEDDIDWLDLPRSHAHREAITAATTLAGHHATHEPEQAIRYLNTALAIDPHNETTARELIRLQLDLGHATAAERTYTTLLEHLDDLGAQPQPATTELIQQGLTTALQQQRHNR